MKKYVVMLLALFVACSGQEKKEDKTEQAKVMPKQAIEMKAEYARTEAGNPIVQVKTTMGDFEIEVFENDCPIHAKNFLQLVEGEIYDDNIFHRVIADFMVQTGDPTGTGGGNPGYWLDQEAKPFKYNNRRSFIAMAQSNPPDAKIFGSQFYILVKDSPHLDDRFPCFAKVIKGMDVVDAISKVKTIDEKPVEPVKIITAKPKPAEAPADTLTEELPS